MIPLRRAIQSKRQLRRLLRPGLLVTKWRTKNAHYLLLQETFNGQKKKVTDRSAALDIVGGLVHWAEDKMCRWGTICIHGTPPVSSDKM
ncbi:hypothetical protein CDAR_461621 [Caerostris darwini]|uniref:Uncharacterized protein n=1 Tax=Caerostris darwini TaxID=1538125 RepID=A0AAV4M7C7_9ARAC|nr:hypothetical protein CDAR_461621 [Caerostris darwini]